MVNLKKLGKLIYDDDKLQNEQILNVVTSDNKRFMKPVKVNSKFLYLLKTGDKRGQSKGNLELYEELTERATDYKKVEEIKEELPVIHTGGMIIDNQVDLKDRYHTLVGMFMSGNTSNEVKNELMNIVNYYYKNGILNKEEIKEFIKFVIYQEQ